MARAKRTRKTDLRDAAGQLAFRADRTAALAVYRDNEGAARQALAAASEAAHVILSSGVTFSDGVMAALRVLLVGK